MNRRRLRKKYWLGLLSQRLFLLPLALGFTLMLASALPGIRATWALGGLIGVLFAVGYLAQSALLGNERIVRQAREELAEEMRTQRADILEALAKELERDQDPRTKRAFDDLMALADAFSENSSWADSMSSASALGLADTVNQTIQQCFDSLRSTVEVSRTARKAASAAVRDAIIYRRNRTIEEVQSSIDNLSRTLGEIQKFRTDGGPSSRLADLRSELKLQLDVAERVDQRLADLRRSAEGPEAMVSPE